MKTEYPSMTDTMKIHFRKDPWNPETILNSAGRSFSVSDYELHFTKQIMAMPTLRARVSAHEMEHAEFYYTAMRIGLNHEKWSSSSWEKELLSAELVQESD